MQPYFTSLPLADRLTATPLITALLEYDADKVRYAGEVCHAWQIVYLRGQLGFSSPSMTLEHTQTHTHLRKQVEFATHGR